MTSPISSVASPSLYGVAEPASTSQTVGTTELGQDAFLKLLIAQLRYQDPTNPVDSTAFLAQTAQFTQVEKLAQIAQDQQSLIYGQLMLSASSLIGRTVSYLGPDDLPVTGVVTSVSFVDGLPLLRVGTDEVPLYAVTEVRATASTTSDDSPTSTGTDV
ncbi:MAG TPA: flagellar hook capping FlgD N-terminal domain-containing protein [Micromonospora sp.]